MEFTGRISTVTFSSDTFIKEVILGKDDILVVGDRYKVIDYAIDSIFDTTVYAFQGGSTYVTTIRDNYEQIIN